MNEMNFIDIISLNHSHHLITKREFHPLTKVEHADGYDGDFDDEDEDDDNDDYINDKFV